MNEEQPSTELKHVLFFSQEGLNLNQLDDESDTIRTSNAILNKLVDDENCLFIETYDSCRLPGGVVSSSLYNRGGIHIHRKYLITLMSTVIGPDVQIASLTFNMIGT